MAVPIDTRHIYPALFLFKRQMVIMILPLKPLMVMLNGETVLGDTIRSLGIRTLDNHKAGIHMVVYHMVDTRMQEHHILIGHQMNDIALHDGSYRLHPVPLNKPFRHPHTQ